jgi:alkanesulfonate monooxygenase SsuD/methylene tetrahydromethanopterin reductase-like flavin-dependent oxidoreductase (luciferase family)
LAEPGSRGGRRACGGSHFRLTEQHFFADIGHSACPETFLAALSQRTKTIRLGFAVILMPCHNPFMIAERVATLDVQSPIAKRMMTERG